MAFREFTDSTGVVWRAWDVTIEQLHPVTRGEDFMGDLQDGWLAFESAHEKRRMAAPYPSDWTELSIPELEALCRRAPLNVTHKPRTTSGEHRAYAAAQADRAVVEEAARTFASPRGREWTVRQHERLGAGGSREVVLRFTSGDATVDLARWPENWRTASLEDYALMLLDAEPPRRPDRGTMPQRRREDRPVDDRQAALPVQRDGGEARPAR